MEMPGPGGYKDLICRKRPGSSLIDIPMQLVVALLRIMMVNNLIPLSMDEEVAQMLAMVIQGGADCLPPLGAEH